MRPSIPPVALVVEPNAGNRLRTVKTLADIGFDVTATDAFDSARRHIATRPPAVLVTALKLGEYNGLHLVLRVRTAAPGTAALVLSEDGGATFQREAQRAGATLVLEPVTSPDLVAAVLRTLFRTDPSASISPPFERRIAERRSAAGSQLPNRRVGERRRDFAALLQVAVLDRTIPHASDLR